MFKKAFVFFLLIGTVAIGGFLAWAIIGGNMLGQAPRFSLQHDGKPLDPATAPTFGKPDTLIINLENPVSALCAITVRASQQRVGGAATEHVLYDQAGGHRSFFPADEDPKTITIPIAVSDLLQNGFRDGELSLAIKAED